MLRYLWIALVVFIFDQITKTLASVYLIELGEVNLTPFLNLVLVHNAGAAFGFLNDAGGWQNMLFITVASVACGVILWMMWRLNKHDVLMAVGLSLVLGGAAGNLVDRLVNGYVIDFIDFYYQSWHWPAFNVADSAISIGAVLLILDAFGFGSKRSH